jgi:L-aspartate oxidase
VRSDKRLQLAKKRIEMLEEEVIQLYRRSVLSPQLCELRNLITTAKLIADHSIKRKENRGVFYKIKGPLTAASEYFFQN